MERFSQPDLAAARGYPTGRKYRLLLVASCRKWIDRPGERVDAALDIAERFADGVATVDELREAEGMVQAAYNGRQEWPGPHMDGRVHDLLRLAEDAATPDPLQDCECWGGFSIGQIDPRFIKDIWPDPSRPIATDPAWFPAWVRSLARVAYEERRPGSWTLDNARLAVLSDALEEAGCTDEAILSHLRSPGPHVRGCWPLDLILGRKD